MQSTQRRRSIGFLSSFSSPCSPSKTPACMRPGAPAAAAAGRVARRRRPSGQGERGGSKRKSLLVRLQRNSRERERVRKSSRKETCSAISTQLTARSLSLPNPFFARDKEPFRETTMNNSVGSETDSTLAFFHAQRGAVAKHAQVRRTKARSERNVPCPAPFAFSNELPRPIFLSPCGLAFSPLFPFLFRLACGLVRDRISFRNQRNEENSAPVLALGAACDIESVSVRLLVDFSFFQPLFFFFLSPCPPAPPPPPKQKNSSPGARSHHRLPRAESRRPRLRPLQGPRPARTGPRRCRRRRGLAQGRARLGRRRLPRPRRVRALSALARKASDCLEDFRERVVVRDFCFEEEQNARRRLCWRSGGGIRRRRVFRERCSFAVAVLLFPLPFARGRGPGRQEAVRLHPEAYHRANASEAFC